MFGRARNLILIVLAAGAGALIGRWVAEARARVDAGDDPLAVDLNDLRVRPQDFIPGIVTAFRASEPPWSWLHLPGWLLAFGTNFATAAVGGDLDRLRQMAEDRVMGAMGLEPEVEIEIEDITPDSATSGDATSTPFQTSPPPPPSAPPEPAAPASEAAGEAPSVWTSENATPPAANGNGKAPEAGTPGFTPLRD